MMKQLDGRTAKLFYEFALEGKMATNVLENC